MANADERGGGAALTVAQIYSKRCDRAASPSFAFGGDERFVLKGETGSRVADAWLFFAKGDAFDGAGRKVRLEMSENDGALYTKLDPTELARPADDKLSAPFTWRYHVGNGAYQSHRGQALTRKSRPIPGK